MNLKVVVGYLPGKVAAIDEMLKGAAYHIQNHNGTIHMLEGPTSAFMRQLLPHNLQIHTNYSDFIVAKSDAVLLLGGGKDELKLASMLEPDPTKLMVCEQSSGAAASMTKSIKLDAGSTPGAHGGNTFMVDIQTALAKYDTSPNVGAAKLKAQLDQFHRSCGIKPTVPAPTTPSPVDPFDL